MMSMKIIITARSHHKYHSHDLNAGPWSNHYPIVRQCAIVGLYGDLSWAQVNLPIWWNGAGTGICGYLIIWHMHGFNYLLNNFRFAIERFICRRNGKWVLCHLRHHARRTLSEACDRSVVAPPTHYIQLTGRSNITLRAVLYEMVETYYVVMRYPYLGNDKAQRLHWCFQMTLGNR